MKIKLLLSFLIVSVVGGVEFFSIASIPWTPTPDWPQLWIAALLLVLFIVGIGFLASIWE